MKARIIGQIKRPPPQLRVVEKRVEVPVEKLVEKIVEKFIDRERVVEKPVVVERIVKKPIVVEIPVGPKREDIRSVVQEELAAQPKTAMPFEFKNGEMRFKQPDGKWGPWHRLGGGGGGLSREQILQLIEDEMADALVLAHTADLTASGNNVIKAPASGKALRLYAYGLYGDPENSDAVVCGLRFGVAGTIFASAKLSQYGGVAAHSYKAGHSYVQGAVDEPLYGNLDGAFPVKANIDYDEVVP